MADRKDCGYYAECQYRNNYGICSHFCMKYRHEDDVRVVRCKDCKHRYTPNNPMCKPFCKKHFTMDARDDNFCSDGERKK